VNSKPNEFIQRFREFVGYVKMRDEKVKGLE
jgi:E3 ubiquitin-protein ligase BRE1